MPWSDIYFSLLCFVYDFKNQNGKFPWLNKNYVSGSFTSFLTSEASRKVSVSWSYFCSLFFACFMAVKFETGISWELFQTLFLVLFLRLQLQNPKPEVSMTSYDLCLFLLFMIFISNKGSFYNLTGYYCFVYSYKIHDRVLITKTTLTKFAGKHPGWKFKT